MVPSNPKIETRNSKGTDKTHTLKSAGVARWWSAENAEVQKEWEEGDGYEMAMSTDEAYDSETY